MAHILLIEPDRLLAESYIQTLQLAGHQLNAASTAQAAIIAADAVTPDLIILEIQLVEHSGIEFLYEFRSYSEWQHIPVIIQTHVPQTEFADSWQLMRRELGVRAYLYKPRTSLRQLRAAVSQHLPVAAAGGAKT